jgi:hypothetical protein
MIGMSLNWDTKNVENGSEVCFITATVDWPMDGTKKGDRLLNPVTSALIWHSLNTGIGTITAENADEVYARISFIEQVYGPSLSTQDGPKAITIEDVRQHVGLYTNASFKIESRASFLKRHAASFLDDAARRYKRTTAEKVAA